MVLVTVGFQNQADFVGFVRVVCAQGLPGTAQAILRRVVIVPACSPQRARPTMARAPPATPAHRPGAG